jgi:deoxyribonucleoside regulator
MARLNVSIPADLSPLVAKWRRKINLSEICTQALRDELAAVESHRSARLIHDKLSPGSSIERSLVDRHSLAEAVVVDAALEPTRLRDHLGSAAADYLDRRLCDGAVLAVAGGRQVWCVVQHLRPRQVALNIQALGFHQNDPHVLHAHPNTLVTILWLYFAPRALAALIGQDPAKILNADLPQRPQPTYFIVGSCARFSAECDLAKLLGSEKASDLLQQKARGDFLYSFFTRDGKVIPAPKSPDRSILPAAIIRSLAARDDARIILVAGGADKLALIRIALKAKLCNVLVTDTQTAQRLLAAKR